MNCSVKKIQQSLSSKEIRKLFLDYFVNNHEHKLVPSSPVIPYCDPTLAFINAGMNQFKSIFLGKIRPQHKRVTNSQKCIRVGGKHNDLSVVGQDGYHHTFFEMLGNWSFNDYFKKEACSMALELLRGPFNINMDRLYVTYFAGDDKLGVPADLECFEIWKSLGLPESRILPFGIKENFWEMSSSGPCGPCSEIHIDRIGNCSNANDRAKYVNANQTDLIELWNLVFIEYNRKEDGTIVKLPTKHVDTGMGFERLVAVIQNKTSNYDTDLFEPIFRAVHESSKVLPYSGSYSVNDDNINVDTAYRILADHARMICVCLADGMLPDQNQKLRRILRKSLLLTEQTFSNEKLLNRLVPIVADTLGTAYPEIILKQNSIIEIIDYERELYKSLRAHASSAFKHILNEYPNLSDIEWFVECPGLVNAYRDFQAVKSNFQNNTIPGDFLYKLYDTYGLTKDSFSKLAELENMECDWMGYEASIVRAKHQKQKHMKDYHLLNNEILMHNKIIAALSDITKTFEPTNNQNKYDYYYNEVTKNYDVPILKTKILGILYNDIKVNEIIAAGGNSQSDLISIITNSSNFYHESGGQESDKGWLLNVSALEVNQTPTKRKLNVVNVQCLNDCIVHICKLCNDENENFSFGCGDDVLLIVDAKRRSRNICHHTAIHLLNAAIRSLYKKVTYQTSSSVSDECGKLEVGLIGKQLSKNDIVQIENLIGQVIKASVPIQVQSCNATDIIYDNDITMIPGEIYPEDNLRLIIIRSNNNDHSLVSKELCCGTHANNTQELEHFRIINFKQINPARYAFTVVAGEAAVKVQNVADLLQNQLDVIEKSFQYKEHYSISFKEYLNSAESELCKIRHNLHQMKIALPYVFKIDALDRINNILKKLKNVGKSNLKELIEIEMRNLLLEKPLDIHPFIVHHLSATHATEEVSLQKATKLCTDRPILIISMNNNVIKARCCVPKKCRNDGFTAQKWLSEVSAIFNAEISAPRGQNPDEVCFMKGKRATQGVDKQLKIALKRANKYAKKFLL